MKFSDKAKQIIGSVAPLIGTALGGPFGALAGTMISKSLGVKEGDDVSIEAAVTGGNPDVLLKLKQADNDFKVQMETLDIKREQLVFDDKANARAREIAVKDKTPAILAFIVTVGFFGTLGYLLINGKPVTGGDALLVMLGALGGAWGAIISYYYGSSASSAKKTELMAHR